MYLIQLMNILEISFYKYITINHYLVINKKSKFKLNLYYF